MPVAKRLDNFVADHMQYEDIGDAENGPHLVSDYVGPEWAIDTMMKEDAPEVYEADAWYTWFMSDDYDENYFIGDC